MLTVSLNTKKLPSLGMLSPSFCVFGHERSPLLQIQEKDLPDSRDRQEMWKLHDQVVSEAQNKYQKVYKKARKTRGGKDFEANQGDYVYVRDRRQHEKRKMHPRYLSAPSLILKNYGNVFLIKNFRGQVSIRHANDLKKCIPRFASLYSSLPISVKYKLGDSFTFDSLRQFSDQNITPEMFYERQIGLDPKLRPKTRTQTAQEDSLGDEILPQTFADQNVENAQFFDLSESDSEPDQLPADNEINVNEAPKVTFAQNA